MVTADAEPQEALLPTWSLLPSAHTHTAAEALKSGESVEQEGASLGGGGWTELENAALSPVDSGRLDESGG